MKKQILTSALAMGIALSWLAPDAMARLLYTDEVDSTDASKFVIDFDEDASGDIELSFGNTTNSGLIAFDLETDTFKFSNNVSVSGSLEVNGDVTLTGNVDIAGDLTLSGNLDLEGNELINARAENLDALDFAGLSLGQDDRGRIAFDYDEQKLKYWTGTEWISVSGTSETSGSVGGISTFIGNTGPSSNDTNNVDLSSVTGTTFDSFGGTQGNMAIDGKAGYEAANHACALQYPGSHMCQVGEIIDTIYAEGAANAFTSVDGLGAWASEGAPGFLAIANDCGGWQSSLDESNGQPVLGAQWGFNTTSGGAGTLTLCNTNQPISCCKAQ